MLKSRKAIPYEENVSCKGFYSEAERLQIQRQFPNNKVFSSRSGCLTDVTYSNTNRAYEFIAVFAGNNRTEAKAFLEKVKQTGNFEGANIRKMQVIVRTGE